MYPSYFRGILFRSLFTAVVIAFGTLQYDVRSIAQTADSDATSGAKNELANWTLRMAGGDTYRGTFAPPASPDRLAWQSPSFLTPLDFPWQKIEKIERQRNNARKSSRNSQLPDNTFCVELFSGHAMSGQLLSLDSEQIRIAVQDIGEQTIPLKDIANVLRVNSNNGSSTEVLQANAWEQVLPAPKNGKATKWFLKAGEISTDTSGTTISQWATIPELATIDIDVAWDQASVNFWLTIGDPRRMELQVRKLQNKNLLNITLGVENSKDADITTVQLPYDQERSISLRVLCDANKGTYILMQDQKILGRIKGNPAERIVGRTKLSFTNTAIGVLTLRDLRISSRPFALPSEVSNSNGPLPEIMTRNRGTFFGSLEASDASGSFQVRGANDAVTAVAFEELERMEFPDKPDQPRSLVFGVELDNGQRFASDRIATENQSKNSDAIATSTILLSFGENSIRIPERDIDRILAQNHGATTETTPQENGSKLLRLLTDNVVSLGTVDAVVKSANQTPTLAWLPRHATASVPINPESDGAIEPAVTRAQSPPRKSKNEPPMAIIRPDTPSPEPELSRSLKPNDPSLFLVSGDCFPGTVNSGDQETIQFQSPLFQQTSVPSSMVRGIRFVEFNGGESLDRMTRNRILTLPRMQRKNPPTHIVVARDGDVARGRLISFNRDQLILEVRGEERNFLVKNIAEVIALEAAPVIKPPAAATDTESEETSPTPSAPSHLYQVILEHGARVSIAPERVDSDTLSGSHPILGPCSLPWPSITRLMLGNSIRVDAARSRFGKWKLQNAPDPKFVTEEGQPPNDAPNDTMHDRLIGKPAPDFDLAKLDGTPCRLEDYRGNVLILDFWASWCGPCIRSMPRMMEISRTYQDLGVELVLVNLEETEDRVRNFLEKLEIMPTVALDTDGSIAKQFGVMAIPQTVLIDRDGSIAKILVGAGDENDAALIKILDELTARDPR